LAGGAGHGETLKVAQANNDEYDNHTVIVYQLC
jgi:hypothetical protein